MSEHMDITFQAEVTEVGAPLDDWQGQGIHTLADGERPFESLIAEMTEGDDEPFFVNLLVAREGIGKGKPRPKHYTSSAIEDIARLLPGVQGYLGHQEKGKRDSEYRTPQMKIVKSRTDTERCPKTGQMLRVARAKGYVSRRAGDLRTHIREKMAGPVSLQGRAVLASKGDRLEVTEMLSLRCVDFCNPGTQGIEDAGVESVVSEMEESDERSNRMTDRLNMSQLRLEYEAEISEIERRAGEEAASNAREPLEAEVSEMKTRLEGETKRADTAETKVAELEEAGKKHTAEIEEMKRSHAELLEKVNERTLEDHRSQAIKTLAEKENLSAEVQEMLGKRVEITLVKDDDTGLTRSKATLQKTVDQAFTEVKEVVEMAGGSLDGKRKKGDPGAGGGNPPRDRADTERLEMADLILARGSKACTPRTRATADAGEE